ncbi:enolase C-terminal domain-like protein [Falsiroseomonas sp.]|uniref:enolase C-terminal domain-like protein n=1 Tax=Falsiroseomonas sp. TaxID=2870721 RepID=UPI00273479D7|nr:enolase C-terminal domain-like protein [Falsiroseomonas sp.]MDP3415493.1 enolase C-terminal domain-like protein [Falsiroseomonas sp.]
MKITNIRSIVVNAQMRNWVFVKVETDQDWLYGWGEATLNWKTRAVVGAIEDLKPLLLGRDPRDIEQICRILQKHSYYRLGIIGMTAISGIEHALWDIFGKSVGLPVWRLLGGKVRDRVKLYTHLGLGDMASVYETFDPEPMVEKAQAILERGYRALKVVFIPYLHQTASPAAVSHVEKLGRRLREAVGQDVEIMIDFHGRPGTVSAALQFIRALEPISPLFCEEPIQPGDTEGMRQIVQQARCPIATGERLVGVREFADLLGARGANIVQPDLNHCGGLLEARKIAAFAEVAQAGIAPHNPNGPLAGIAALHFAVATPNFVIQEAMPGSVPWYHDVVRQPVVATDGYWPVPDLPGFGVEVDEKEAARHPFVQEVMHTANAVLDDGTIVDW